MDRPSAKREACWRAAGLLKNAMTNGWPHAEKHGWSEQDHARVQDGLFELIDELTRRARLPEDIPVRDWRSPG